MNIFEMGAYQLSNIVKSRVPFLLIRTEDIEIEKCFGVMEKIHLRNFSIVLSQLEINEALSHLNERKVAFDFPLILIDQEGSIAPALVEELNLKGYQNVFYIKEGWRKAQQELIS